MMETVIRLSGKASTVFALIALKAKLQGNKTMKEMGK